MWIWYMLIPYWATHGIITGTTHVMDTGFTNEHNKSPLRLSECEWRIPNKPGDWSTED